MAFSHSIEKQNGPSLLHWKTKWLEAITLKNTMALSLLYLKTQWLKAIVLKNKMALHSYI
jgi:hypothetical protein